MSALVGVGELAQALKHLVFSSTPWIPIFRVTWCFWFPNFWGLLVGTAGIYVGFSSCRSFAERRQLKCNPVTLPLFLFHFPKFFFFFSLSLVLSLSLCSLGFTPFYSLNSYSSGILGESGDKCVCQSTSFNWKLSWCSLFLFQKLTFSVVAGCVGLPAFH